MQSLYWHDSYNISAKVIIFCSDTINVVHRIDSSVYNEFIEFVFIDIPIDVFRIDKNIMVVLIYWPPKTGVSQCRILLNETLMQIQKEGKSAT